jgi:hypothetical protein
MKDEIRMISLRFGRIYSAKPKIEMEGELL